MSPAADEPSGRDDVPAVATLAGGGSSDGGDAPRGGLEQSRPRMDATDAQLAPARTPLEVLTGARLFISDVEHLVDDARVAYRLADHVWELGVARVFGVSMQDQSVVVKMVLT